jgi:hypothetical protein
MRPRGIFLFLTFLDARIIVLRHPFAFSSSPLVER